MEQSFAYANVVSGNNEMIEIYMNDGIMEENVNVQTKTSKNPQNEREQEMKINLRKLQAQRKSQKPHGRLSLCWNFYLVNGNAKVNLKNTQIMCCIICYQEPIIRINLKIQAKKGLIFYYKTNQITSI